MTRPPPGASTAKVRGIASGVLLMAFFGTLWASIGSYGLQGWGGRWPTIAAIGVGAGLSAAGLALLQAARRLPRGSRSAQKPRPNRLGVWFGLVFAAEGLLIGAASALLTALGRPELFFSVTAGIVGAHFFPLAALFRIRPYYLVGAALCLLASLALRLAPIEAPFREHQVLAQTVVVGFGTALILWLTGLGLWRYGRQLLRHGRG